MSARKQKKLLVLAAGVLVLAALIVGICVSCGRGEYLSLASVGKFDSGEIPTSILQRESSLPNATKASLPLWKGAAIYNKSSTLTPRRDRAFSEEDPAFLNEAGMNYMRVELDFSTLQYPNYPSDKEQVNTAELIELDKLIGWCIERDIHLTIAMCGLPGEGKAKAEDRGDFFSDSSARELTAKYWKMLARRYSPISSKYLSFCVISNADASSAEDYAKCIAPVVAAVWNVSPERVVIADVRSAEEAAAVGALGVACSCSLTVDIASDNLALPEGWLESVVKPIRTAAKTYGVGVMVGSMGIVTDADMGDTYYNYYEAAAQCVNQNGLGWCLSDLHGENALIGDGAFLQSGAESSEMTVAIKGGKAKVLFDSRLLGTLTGVS